MSPKLCTATNSTIAAIAMFVSAADSRATPRNARPTASARNSADATSAWASWPAGSSSPENASARRSRRAEREDERDNRHAGGGHELHAPQRVGAHRREKRDREPTPAAARAITGTGPSSSTPGIAAPPSASSATSPPAKRQAAAKRSRSR